MKFSLFNSLCIHIAAIATIVNAATLGAGCEITGCNSEICANRGTGLASVCIALPQFQCYRSATCEKQPNGQCEWSQTDSLKACLGTYVKTTVTKTSPTPTSTLQCTIGACPDLCVSTLDPPMGRPCYAGDVPKYDCYKKYGTCTPQSSGFCGWNQDSALEACLKAASTTTATTTTSVTPFPTPKIQCTIGACPDLCVSTLDPPMGRPCYAGDVPKYDCYKKYGTCTPQSTGYCGWNKDSVLDDCLKAASITTTTTTTSASPSPTTKCSAVWGQCGGIWYKGPICCDSPSKCVLVNSCKYLDPFFAFSKLKRIKKH
ncbi:hypothetical protein HK098_000639 [Nowakowskiella sp. JEL0407]|nr:hypothetical protein HK098_000639 [Nowakowskiella sp. JEL0407]